MPNDISRKRSHEESSGRKSPETSQKKHKDNHFLQPQSPFLSKTTIENKKQDQRDKHEHIVHSVKPLMDMGERFGGWFKHMSRDGVKRFLEGGKRYGGWVKLLSTKDSETLTYMVQEDCSLALSFSQEDVKHMSHLPGGLLKLLDREGLKNFLQQGKQYGGWIDSLSSQDRQLLTHKIQDEKQLLSYLSREDLLVLAVLHRSHSKHLQSGAESDALQFAPLQTFAPRTIDLTSQSGPHFQGLLAGTLELGYSFRDTCLNEEQRKQLHEYQQASSNKYNIEGLDGKKYFRIYDNISQNHNSKGGIIRYIEKKYPDMLEQIETWLKNYHRELDEGLCTPRAVDFLTQQEREYYRNVDGSEKALESRRIYTKAGTMVKNVLNAEKIKSELNEMRATPDYKAAFGESPGEGSSSQHPIVLEDADNRGVRPSTGQLRLTAKDMANYHNSDKKRRDNGW